MGETDMTDNQNEQKNLPEDGKHISENTREYVEEYSFASFAKEIFLVIAVPMVLMFLVVLVSIFSISDPLFIDHLFIISEYFQVVVYILVFVLATAACALLFAYMVMLGIDKSYAHNIPLYAVYTFRFLLIASVLFTAMMLPTSGPSRVSAETSNIVSNLRSLHSASLMFYEDKGELIRELPRGVNILEYLTQYTSHPDSPVWNNYIFIISSDYWWVGLDLRRSNTRSDVRHRLVSRAESLGLFGTSGAEPPLSADRVYQYQVNDAFVWLLVRTPAVDEANGGN